MPNFIHGHKRNGKRTRTYVIWSNMRDRCNNPRSISYKYYGARGIRVCARWKFFINFLEDMGACPLGLTLDRKNNSLGYSKSNCRWATTSVQNSNKGNARKLLFRGEVKNQTQWAKEFGIKDNVINWRLSNGWSVERALTTKRGKHALAGTG